MFDITYCAHEECSNMDCFRNTKRLSSGEKVHADTDKFVTCRTYINEVGPDELVQALREAYIKQHGKEPK